MQLIIDYREFWSKKKIKDHKLSKRCLVLLIKSDAVYFLFNFANDKTVALLKCLVLSMISC